MWTDCCKERQHSDQTAAGEQTTDKLKLIWFYTTTHKENQMEVEQNYGTLTEGKYLNSVFQT